VKRKPTSTLDAIRSAAVNWEVIRQHLRSEHLSNDVLTAYRALTRDLAVAEEAAERSEG